MVKIALKKCSLWQKLHFYGANLIVLGGRLFRSTRSGGIEKYIEVVSVII